MGDISLDFSEHEFACRCGQMNCPPAHIFRELVDLHLQPLRDHLGFAITPTSGIRCPRHNANEKGARDSLHIPVKVEGGGLVGFAVDFRIKDKSRLLDAFMFLDTMRPYFLGLYLDINIIHLSDGRKRARDPAGFVRWLQGLDSRKATFLRRYV